MALPLSLNLPADYRALADDVLRIAAIQALVHIMFVVDGTDKFADGRVVALLMYTLLGLAFYHLVVRKVLVTAAPAGLEGKDAQEKTA